jgi:hypothetical protein
MSEFDQLKDDAEKYAQDHPDQVQKGEGAVEDKLGLPGQDSGSGQQDQSGQNQPGQNQPAQDQSGQDQSGQDQSGQGGQYDQGAGPGGEDQQNSGDGGGQ